MIGIGAANIAAGFFQGFPVSTSGSRTAVADTAGSRSQVTGLVGAAVITVVIVFATEVMQYVPQPTLGAVVIAAALSLADIPATRRLWQQRRIEFTLSIIALLGVAFLGVLPGIVIAVGLSILNVFRKVWWPHQAELGRVDGIAGLHDTESYPGADQLPGLLIYRFDAPLIFANSRTFADEMRALAEERTDLRWILIAAEPITDVDTTASDMLQELDEWLNERGVSLVFAEMKDPVRAKIERYELTRTIDPAHFFPTLDDAVARYREETGTTWQPPEAGHDRRKQLSEPSARRRLAAVRGVGCASRHGRGAGRRSLPALGCAPRQPAGVECGRCRVVVRAVATRQPGAIVAAVAVVAGLAGFVGVLLASRSFWVLAVALLLAMVSVAATGDCLPDTFGGVTARRAGDSAESGSPRSSHEPEVGWRQGGEVRSARPVPRAWHRTDRSPAR